MKKLFSVLFKFAFWSLITLILSIVIFNIISNTQAVKGYRSFLVQSGSMEPTIMTGDVILVKEQNSYIVNDVITFTDNTGRKVTHRIIETQQNTTPPIFITKGDANRTADNASVSGKKIVGKVALVIPKLGFLVAFSKTIPGFIFLVAIPIVFILFDEIKNFSLAKKTRR